MEQASQQSPIEQHNGPIGVGEIPMDNAETKPASQPQLQIENMDKIEGYQEFVNPNVSFVPPPPSYAQSMQQQQQGAANRERFRPHSQITEQEARACLLRLVRAQCCLHASAMEKMTFLSTEDSPVMQYTVKTFLETRNTKWTHEAYRGQPIDGPSFGQPPRPWDVPIQPPPWFDDQVFNTEVPHTASVKMCYKCCGSAMILCYNCSGWGYRRCYSCNGTGGQRYNQQVSFCNMCEGVGQRPCYSCQNRGRSPCDMCMASGLLKYYINLRTEFKTHVDDFILDRTPLPERLIRDIEGEVTFEETGPAVFPLQNHRIPEMNRHSADLIQHHRQLAQSGHIWMQSHTLYEIPVFQCDYVYKERTMQFFVFGLERGVYADFYPQCCCEECGCCEIL